MAVVKADAYGHGAVRCARRLVAAGAEWLAVALVEEGIELRNAGITAPILCLGGCWPGQAEVLLRANITPIVFIAEQAAELDREARNRGLIANVHVKIDTGMGRVGVPFREVGDFLDGLKQFRNLRVEGLMTHFAAADRPEENQYTNHQIERFETAIVAFREAGHNPVMFDMANSPGAIVHPRAQAGMVRLGGILYGLGGDVLPPGVPKPKLKPVMSVTTQIAQVKRVPAGETLGYGRTFTTGRASAIATIGIGYHDGLPRSLSNLGQVIVRGVRVPIVGRVSMDWTIIDVTHIPGVQLGDRVTIIGRDGTESILAEDIAGLAGTISYEITCGIGARVQRRYVD
jgi:alanine racemase